MPRPAILVTGGLGYIGSHTAVELINKKYPVVIVDNLINSEAEQLKRLTAITGSSPTFYQADICNPKALAAIFTRHHVGGVIHFAALKSVNESIKSPLIYYQNNLGGLLTLIQTMDRYRVGKLIFSSSATVYGAADKLPVTEDSPLKPATNPYGSTKQMGEAIITDCVLAGQLQQAVLLRYFNPIGAHPSGLLGELPRGTPNNLVPYLTQTAAGQRKQLVVFGDDYPTPDGTCIRDYIHVVDLAKAHIKALEFTLNRNRSYARAFNIGTGRGTSVLELLNAFQSATGVNVPYKIGRRRPGDVAVSYADVKSAARILNWRSSLTIEEALLDTWRWQQSIMN
mgnify:CR=1 FL=1